ncbi:chymase-like [Sinocyclocheilus anshuiensis]|uniref:Chymase-like n=1 Tax=Sinocyclocheilus anshuiensis TaxID=1608454 RepID=A0A671SJZ0_9TELE|nr:PREDICTED: chymase-like [Sinocyclocheilus anshuiensis]
MSILWHITCLLLLRSCTPGFSMHDGIVGGRVSIPHSRPYMVYIRDKISQLTCDGFLIREDYVMTAAHCKQSHLVVFVGVHDINFLPDGIEVDPIPHPKFSMERPDHDIMLLKGLSTPVPLSKSLQTIIYQNPENEEISKDCMVVGWGWQDYHDESPSNVLQEANVTLIDSENCGTADTLCTEGSTEPAQGDSGGPLVCGGVAEGIVSFSKTKSNADHLSAYTRISLYYPWIQSIINPPTQQQSETWKGKLDKLI